jgi:DNA polymerase I
MAKKNREEIYLIDGSAYIHRAYHAMGGLSNSKGFPTGAVFGFTNMIVKTMRERKPNRIAVVFDAPGKTFRHDQYPDYKANRPSMPDDLRLQIPKIHEIVAAYNLPSLALNGYEADDIIATLTHQARQKGWSTIIVSGDKDLTQLVGPDVLMWDPQRDVLYDSRAVEEKFGVPPEKILDLMALMGDSSDNIPGIPGVGQKTASNLLQQFGSLDGIIENVDKISRKKLQEAIGTNRDQAFLSKKLASLCFEAPLDIEIDALVPGANNVDELRKIFKELEFKKLLTELPPSRNLDFSGYTTVLDKEALLSWRHKMLEAGRFAVDLETTSQEPVRADLVGISLAAEPGRACYIPVGHSTGTQLLKSDVLTALKPLLEDQTLAKIGQNIKYDMIVLKKEGVEIRGISFDTMLASYILDPSRRGHSLDDLAEIFLEHRTIHIRDLIGTGKNQISFAGVPVPEASVYACEDADVTIRVANILAPRVQAEGLDSLLRDIELPLIPVLCDMELAGVRIDSDYLRQLSAEFGEILKKREIEIFALAGEVFNINSPKQLGEILFEKLGMKPVRKSKSGPSTALDVLEELAFQHDLPRKILDYRSIFKLKSTYADSLTNLVNPVTGRIHTSYNQAVAATGRLSSSDPNLQNIPIRSSEGRKIRRAFIPDEGHSFVAADYSQIELRIMAHLSGDERLSQAFATGEDVHSITAASIFDCALELITPDMRRKAKEINFGIIYGMGPFKLSNQIGVTMKEAKKYLEDYYDTYAGVKRYMEELPEKAATVGFVTTILGRKRFLPDLNNPNRVAQQAAKRMAINTSIQGSAADIMKLAMIRTHQSLKAGNPPARMILQVHDELILEVADRYAEDAALLLKKEMEEVYRLSVPLVVDAAIGKNWDEAH